MVKLRLVLFIIHVICEPLLRAIVGQAIPTVSGRKRTISRVARTEVRKKRWIEKGGWKS